MKGILRNFNFVILLIGRCLSNIGSSLYAVAAMWLVYELGGSSFYTGLALFLTQAPALLQVILGPVIDRIRMKKLLIYTQILQVLLLLAVPIADALGFLSIGVVLFIMPIVSLCNQFLYPAQLSILPRILKKEQLTKGNSIFAVAYQGTEALFDALAGLLLAVIGAVVVFYINSLMFLLSALLFLALRLPFISLSEPSSSENQTIKGMVLEYFSQLKEGIKVLFHPFFLWLLGGVLFVNLAGTAMFAILPAFSDSHGGPQYYGLFLSAAGIGVITGAALVSLLKLQRIRVGRLYTAVIALIGICMIVLSFVSNPWISIILFGIAWLPAGIINVTSQVIIQSSIPDHMLGRVMAAVMGISAGIAPIGALLGGAVGAVMTSASVILGGGMIMFIVAVIWKFSKTMQRVPAVKDLTPDTFKV
ncbi:MFS transporter [Oceanobacillus jeddahense]|uniref:MFS transporter n=1 Tax=Oceanobacillus jeddahense TaxID=1462527 RepID=A0ABY5JZ44_9BACI|nr:MFS transporter [Oceanobacillus jeddahense]UUI04418.1 MFS transporter [Oceanobacillus jeddahense]